jgi:hypothetical protein
LETCWGPNKTETSYMLHPVRLPDNNHTCSWMDSNSTLPP